MNNLPLLRLKNGKMTQKELADAVNVSLTTARSWEEDIGKLRVKHLKELCELFDVTPDELLGFKDIKF